MSHRRHTLARGGQGQVHLVAIRAAQHPLETPRPRIRRSAGEARAQGARHIAGYEAFKNIDRIEFEKPDSHGQQTH